MSKKEAAARLKINKLLEDADWRLFDSERGRANVDVETRLSPGNEVNIQQSGEDFENVKGGFIDYLLLDDNQKPVAVLEAKRESIPPLSAKEQARNYAIGMHVRFVILSNGNSHFLWNMKEGNPEPISHFPTLESLQDLSEYKLQPETLSSATVDETYIAQSQIPDFASSSEYIEGGDTRKQYLERNKLKIMRAYQVDAIHAIQRAASEGKQRYLLEMATGTGKTLTCAAIIKLFLKTGNAKRVLFLVDRIELEDQAQKAFTQAIGADFTVLTYKKHKQDWGKAEVIVSTVQSLQANDRYRTEFTPTDFDLVISDEAHRSIGGNARAVFEYFVGYRVGLTATPKDYLKGTEDAEEGTQKDFERRQLLDTYTIFGCESGQPTFRYSLTDGVKDPNGPYLVNPVIIDARTDITTQLLSTEGYAVHKVTEESVEVDAIFSARDFERKFFNEKTNEVLAETFLENADIDPISGEIGKSIIFAVSQAHAAKIVNILNRIAIDRWPGKYESDFAVQITSNVRDAQEYTVRFSENDLLGRTKWLDNYLSSRARVAVTVGMMTTGYDCSDLQNVVFMRPVFSPSDFIQMKGRGTRLNTFTYVDYANNQETTAQRKESFKLIDFFAVCEYFNERYDYKAPLVVPKISQPTSVAEPGVADPGIIIDDSAPRYGVAELGEDDVLKQANRTDIGKEGMVIDREMFRAFVEETRDDAELQRLDEEDPLAALEYLKNNVLGKASHHMTLDKMKKHFKLDRRISLGEALDIIMGRVDEPADRQAIIDTKFQDFVTTQGYAEQLADAPELFKLTERLFDTYISSDTVKRAIDNREFGNLAQSNQLTIVEYTVLHNAGLVQPIVQYIRDYVDTDKLKG